jgi:hypothetical protein
METKPPPPSIYRNFLSRLILRRSAGEQFLIPLRPKAPIFVAFMNWYEQHILHVDTSNIIVDRPIFLTGLPRSGTTILQDVLCAHPHLAFVTNAMNEYPACFCAIEALRKRFDLDFKVERYLGDSLEIRPGSANEGLALLARWAGIDLYSLEGQKLRKEDFSPEEMALGLETIKRIIWCFGYGPRRLFNKNPGLLPYLSMLPELFPDCRIIHLVRDPRMCANSMLKLCRLNRAREVEMRRKLGSPRDEQSLFLPYPRFPRLAEYVETFGADSISTTAHLWNDAMTFVEGARQDVRSFYNVRYEDILANPRQEILKILDFCELSTVDDPQAPLWTAAARIGAIHHTNAYGNFELIESVCRDNMRNYCYV